MRVMIRTVACNRKTRALASVIVSHFSLFKVINAWEENEILDIALVEIFSGYSLDGRFKTL